MPRWPPAPTGTPDHSAHPAHPATVPFSPRAGRRWREAPDEVQALRSLLDAAILELRRPVLLDLSDQLRRQRHVIQRGGLLLAVVQRPFEERAGRGAALRILRLLVHQ